VTSTLLKYLRYEVALETYVCGIQIKIFKILSLAVVICLSLLSLTMLLMPPANECMLMLPIMKHRILNNSRLIVLIHFAVELTLLNMGQAFV
jgi:hypothetical protein